MKIPILSLNIDGTAPFALTTAAGGIDYRATNSPTPARQDLVRQVAAADIVGTWLLPSVRFLDELTLEAMNKLDLEANRTSGSTDRCAPQIELKKLCGARHASQVPRTCALQT
jgi:hypothetical protein